MSHLKKFFLYTFSVIIITLFCSLIILYTAFSYDLPGWYQGASGYEDALNASKKNETTIIIFFYIESEELCQKLTDNYLSNYEVYSFLDDFLNAAL